MAVKIKKITGTLLLIVVLILIVSYSEMIVYGFRQGKGQLEILTNAKPVEEFLNEKSFPDSLKTKIQLIQEIRKFAVDSLGLINSENYTTLYDQRGKPILWVVNACPPFSLEEHKWEYPFLGKLGYKGFFEKELAISEEIDFKEKGFDTNIGTVSGWSTLGWFKDPILSNMLYRSDGRLADLIIHELTHATLFVKGDAKFNENLATFIGNNGAREFLVYKYGVDSKELKEYREYLSQSKLMAEHFKKGAEKLKALYESFESGEQSDLFKKEQKRKMIEEIFLNTDSNTLVDAKRLERIYNRDTIPPNNTFFTSYLMYYDKQLKLTTEFEEKYKGDFKEFLKAMKSKYGNEAFN